MNKEQFEIALGDWKDFFHYAEDNSIRVCDSCGCRMPVSSFNGADGTCNECYKDWDLNSHKASLPTPEYKQYTRLLANIKYPKAEICVIPHCREMGDRHHMDYNKPTEIVWLCPKHHAELHTRLRNGYGKAR